MPRESFVIRDGQCVPKHLAGSPPRGPASGLPRPMVISDSCEFRSMVDGQMVTSKAKYRADLRARGYEEVGNEKLNTAPTPAPKMGGMKDDIRRAISELTA